MAHSDFDDSSFGSGLYFNSNDQDILTSARTSINKSAATNGEMAKSTPKKRSSAGRKDTKDSTDTYTSPVLQIPGSGSLHDMSFDNSPFLDYDLDGPNFDWDINGQMVGALPGQEGDSPEEDDDESGDKRKSPDDVDDDDEDGGGKRRDSEDRTGKKPGRKPLTSEPTTKRKAQNRAAQRAFRERKERHLKELETKVDDLEKAGESANHENGLLRAQVERLQSELKEHRKRMSTNGTATRSSPQAAPPGLSSKTNWDISNNFQFAFPKFGPLGSDPLTSPNVASPGLQGYSTTSPISVTSQSNPANQPLSFSNTGTDDFSALFSPSVLANTNSNNSSPDYSSLSGQIQPVRRSTNNSKGRNQGETNTTSPASSASHGGFISSSATTPDSCADSPEQRKASEAAFNSISEEEQRRDSGNHEAFCKDFQTACGTKQDPVPPMMTDSNKSPASAATTANQPNTPGLETQGIDWFANQNGGAFDPVLFGDYRDPQENIMNSDFGFFNDAFAMPDFTHSEALDATSNHKGRDLIQQIEDTQSGKEAEVVPADKAKQFLTCNMLWDRVQRSQKVQSGEADMDDLCSQLKSKAKCSGNGAVIEQNDVDAILGPAPDDVRDFFKMFK